LALAAGLATLAGAGLAPAQLTEYVWDTTKTGAQTWQAANWAPAIFPNDPLHLANLARPLGANLSVNIGSGVTVAGVALGATATPRTTEISSSGGLLTFRNNDLAARADFNSNTIVEGGDFLVWQRGFGLGGQNNTNANGDADLSTIVDGADFQIWKDEFGEGLIAAKGSSYINSIGAAGSVNLISANIHLDNEQLGINGNNNLTINGNLTFAGDAANLGISAAALRVNRAGQTVTLNGGLTIVNDVDPAEGADNIDFRLNDTERSQGRLVINGPISGTGQMIIGTQATGTLANFGTVELNGANTFNGSIRFGRGNVILGSDNAIGINPGPTPDPADDTLANFRQIGPANQFGYNLISTNDSRNIPNSLTLAQWQTIRGDHSLTLSGTVSQTNNRGLINLLPAGKTLTLSGRINIWEDDEPTVLRRFEIDGTGVTRITGAIHNDPLDSSEPRELVKRGSGVLIIDVAPGNNQHSGPDVIYQGNMHYTSNNSLGPTIRSYGGAVGVDTGVANNAVFASVIHPESNGGLMLAPSDANATLDFSASGTLANVANMTVAPPEGPTPYTFTGSIIPGNNKYGLGGGTGTLILPNAQLTGAGNRLEVRNGGEVQLLGNNTYGGSTTIITKYTSTSQEQALLNNASQANPLQYAQVAPTLVVNKLANGGQPSSMGNSSSDAANLFIQGSTLKYVGTGDSTNRLFTIGTGGATIDASGTGALAFTNTGLLGRDDAEDRLGALDDFNRNPNVLYDFTDTSDIIVGMTVNDPDAGTPGNFTGANAGLPNRLAFSAALAGVPAVTVTGISDDGRELGINVNTPFIYKLTRIVFGTVPRTLTLSASASSGSNSMAPVISNSAAGGVVNIAKTGAGTWILNGNNTYTGTTTVQAGTLIVNGTQTGGGAYSVAAGATIGGGGTLGGNLAVSGTVNPGAAGAAAGTLAVTGNTTFATGSTAVFQIGGTSGSQFDQLNMTGTLTAGGTLSVSLIGGFVPNVNDSFDILDFTTATGSFTLNLQSPGPGRAWNTSNLLTTGTISVVAAVTAVPEPGALAPLGIGMAAAVVQRRRRMAGCCS